MRGQIRSAISSRNHRASAYEISGQIVGQVQQLGELLDDSKPLKSLFGSAHDKTNLTDQWRAVQQLLQDNLPVSDPVALYGDCVKAKKGKAPGTCHRSWRLAYEQRRSR